MIHSKTDVEKNNDDKMSWSFAELLQEPAPTLCKMPNISLIGGAATYNGIKITGLLEAQKPASSDALPR